MPLLLKTEDNALVLLLKSSIEALQMGSPIRKSVDEDVEQCVEWLRIELEKRLEASSKRIITEADVNVKFLPVVNEDIFLYLLNRAATEEDADALEILQSMDYAMPELLIKDSTSMASILYAFQSYLVSGRTQSSGLDSFIHMFVAAVKAGDEDVADKIKGIRAFMNVFQAAATSSGSLEGMDIMAADDLGKLIGCLASFSILHPELYLETSKGASNDDNSDDSSDEEMEERPKKKRKMSADAMKQIEKECSRDINLMLSLFYSSLSYSKRLRAIAAGFTTGFVTVILWQDEDLCSVLYSSQLTNRTKAKLSREASGCLIESMELGNVIDRRDLPSVKLISDGKKRCALICKWAQRIIMMAAEHAMQAAGERTILSDGTDGEEEGQSSDVLFLMDRNPTGENGEEEEDEEMESDDEEEQDEEMGNDDEEEQDIDSEGEGDDHDIAPLFVLDTDAVKATAGEDKSADSASDDKPMHTSSDDGNGNDAQDGQEETAKDAKPDATKMTRKEKRAMKKAESDAAAAKAAAKADTPKKTKSPKQGKKHAEPDVAPLVVLDTAPVKATAKADTPKKTKSPKQVKTNAEPDVAPLVVLDTAANKATAKADTPKKTKSPKQVKKNAESDVAPLVVLDTTPVKAAAKADTPKKTKSPKQVKKNAEPVVAPLVVLDTTPVKATAKAATPKKTKSPKQVKKNAEPDVAPLVVLDTAANKATTGKDTSDDVENDIDDGNDNNAQEGEDETVKDAKPDAPKKTKSPKRVKKKVVAMLPSVPEDQEAINVASPKVKSTESNNNGDNESAPATPSRARVQPASPADTPSRSTRSGSVSSVDTPSRMTRSRKPATSESTVESIESDVALTTPSRKRTKRDASVASDASDAEGTPLRRSSRRK